jgi:hypothetical protein
LSPFVTISAGAQAPYTQKNREENVLFPSSHLSSDGITPLAVELSSARALKRPVWKQSEPAQNRLS